jgi:hypothetical protein
VFRAETATAGSKESVDSALQAAEAEATLDVLTGGWFGGWRASVKDPGAAGIP